MHDSKMIAEVAPPGCCAIWNVSGRRIATPLAPPSPGSTPMITPSTMPANISIRLNHESATPKPPIRFWISCMELRPSLAVAEERFDRSLGQRQQEPHLEHQEEDQHRPDAYREDLCEAVLAQVPHEERDEDRGSLVDPERIEGILDEEHV